MKKHLLTAVMGTMIVSSAVFAADTAPQMPNDMPPPPMHEEGAPDDMPPPPAHEEGDRERKGPDFRHFNKEKRDAEMKKHQEAFMRRLNLTAEQKKQAEEIHKQGMDEMKPIMDQMKELREKAREIRQKNKTEFETLLTPEQKKILEQMHQERQSQKEKHFKERGMPGTPFKMPRAKAAVDA